jgi:hypothetical protein
MGPQRLQPIGQEQQHDPNIVRHRQQHSPEHLGLNPGSFAAPGPRLGLGRRLQPHQLAHAFNDVREDGIKIPSNLLHWPAISRLDQKRSSERCFIGTKIFEDGGCTFGML